MDAPITLSLITALTPAVLSKTYWLDAQNTLQKKTGGQLVEGSTERIELPDLRAFAELLGTLTPTQALAYGVTELEQAVLKVAKHPDVANGTAIARTRDHFSYPSSAGILMLDYDPPKTGTPFTRERLLAAMVEAVPELEHCAKVWFPSASSFIYTDAGEELTGLRGQRLYIGVASASKITALGAAIEARLWAAGYGYFAISGSGSLLKRCLVDTSVWQPERLDFAGGAQCCTGLHQRRGEPFYIEGDLLQELYVDADTRKAADKAEKLARKAMTDEANDVREQWIDDRARLHVGNTADETVLNEAKANLKRTLAHDVLLGDFVLYVKDKDAQIKPVTVGEALDNPYYYNGLATLDPLEPEYNGRKLCAKLYINGRNNLYSQAHGGKNYKLLRQPKQIELQEGELTTITHKLIELMAAHPDLYSYSGQLVRVRNGIIEPLKESDVLMWCGANVSFYGVIKQGGGYQQIFKDAPIRLLKTLLEQAPMHVRELKAVITSLVVRPDGTVLHKAGYDAATGYLLDSLHDLPPVPDAPTVEDVFKAADTLLHPFSAFPFCTPLDRSVLLAALLTAVTSPSVDTRPAFAFDAPSKGSGKTLLAKCIARLLENDSPKLYTHTSKDKNGDEETRKRLFSALLGGEPVVIWDNIIGEFDSASFASTLTSPYVRDRPLGKSITVGTRNNTLFLLTGNNLHLAGELPRRVLKCRIDPDTPRPFARRFELNPETYCRDNRHQMLTAAAVVIRGWLTAHAHGEPLAQGSLASFEQWDDKVRQPIAWLARLRPDWFGDVMEVIATAFEADPEAQAVGALFDALHSKFDSRVFSSNEAHAQSYLNGYQRTFLGEAFEDIYGRASVSTRAMGRMLANRASRIANGYKLLKVGTISAPAYKVIKI